MAVRERWIYPSDGSPKYQVAVDHVSTRPVAPIIQMGLGNERKMARNGQVPVQEAKRLIQDNDRNRALAEKGRKAERQRDVAAVFNGLGGGQYA